jgi:hypothetical protein
MVLTSHQVKSNFVFENNIISQNILLLMPTIKRERKEYQKKYYLKYRNEYQMECPVCGHTVRDYPKHCETKLHKKNVEKKINNQA